MKKLATLLFALLFAQLAFAQSKAETRKLQWLEGAWEGVGYQVPTNTTWSVRLEVKDGVPHISYPSLDCAGKWVFVDLHEQHVEFREVIEEGISKCDNEGQIFVHFLKPGYISVVYFLPNYMEGVVAHAVLEKK